MSEDTKRQIFQSVGQFIVVVVSGLLIYKDFTAFLQTGAANAITRRAPAARGIGAAPGPRADRA